ncbi:RNA/RNP complex-1-interacting phosphatase [Dromaius novaehollandiae]|uniref:RNA/RNP complex-1-interacting phosphatase n=1 Tax=Dromaius novaehollandiae TaxID=8790 RepID=UPI00311E9D96
MAAARGQRGGSGSGGGGGGWVRGAAMPGRGGVRVPDRWTDYVPLGRRLPGTRFIAFKVPLRRSFNRNLHPEDRFSPRDLLRKIKEQKEELGLIIDLTYTTRYYGPEDLPATLRYSKILTMGHEIPNDQTIYQFKCVVKNFLRENQDNDKLIGVHCTHGLNRTGYLVCRYLIDVDSMEPNTAIELFNRARGHPIERVNYIEDLRKRSVKKLLPSQQRWQGNSECRMSGYAKKDSWRDKACAHRQELVHEHCAAREMCPNSLGPRNCPVPSPYSEHYDGLCFPAQGPGFHLPQETHTAKKRRRRRRKPVTA